MKKMLFLFLKGIKFFKKNLTNNLNSNISIITILLLLNTIGILIYSTNSFFDKLTSVEAIRIYLKTDDKDTINNLKNSIKKLEGIKNIKYFSSQDAYNFLIKNEYIDEYLKLLPTELFPSFIEVKIKESFRDLNYINRLKEQIEQFNGVEKTSIGETWILNFMKIKYSLNFFFLILLIFISLSIASITHNMIKLNMYKFKTEIKILSLVGATKSFILIPIIIASVIENIISFIFAAFLTYIIYNIGVKAILSILEFKFLILPDTKIVFTYLIVFLILIIGFSYFSASSFLKSAGSIHDN
ncbi:cell division protein FtsX [Deferribacter abyssi]|uniref:cell division protein FtsX n=1 Tax=Deferribacter abyssi TaxID=213806 RepID=UPI003C1774AA